MDYLRLALIRSQEDRKACVADELIHLCALAENNHDEYAAVLEEFQKRKNDNKG
jgi:hypothetical protein